MRVLTKRSLKNQLCLGLLPLLLFMLATIWVRVADADMAVQRFFWDKENAKWTHDTNVFLRWVYGFGVVPALTLGMASLTLLLAGIGRMDLAKYRKIAGYFLLVLLLGSGLIANLLLKGMWGRPRPSQVAEFGGAFSFEPVMTMDFASSGKSFPCGHCTMGFFFFAVALAIPARFLVLRWLVAGFALVSGGLLGIARISQGGHFLSDVIWAAVVMWFVSYGLFHVMKLSENRLYVPKKPFAVQVPKWAWAIYVPVLSLGLLLALLGTPYEEKGKLRLPEQKFSEIKYEGEGDVIVIEGEGMSIEYQAEGFGVPNSKLRFHTVMSENGVLRITPYKKGFFTELRAKVKVVIPKGSEIQVSKGADGNESVRVEE